MGEGASQGQGFGSDINILRSFLISTPASTPTLNAKKTPYQGTGDTEAQAVLFLPGTKPQGGAAKDVGPWRKPCGSR